MARTKKSQPDWGRLRNMVLEIDAAKLMEPFKHMDGHGIYSTNVITDAGWPDEIALAFVDTFESDTSDQKTTIFVKDQPVKSLTGIYGLRVMEFVAGAYGLSSAKLGRGSRYFDLYEQLEAFLKNRHKTDAVIGIESIALDTCKQLVKQGKNFTCERVEKGWKFHIEKE